MTDNGEILEPQGDHHAWYSLQPFLEAGKWSSTPGTYFKEMKEKNGGAPIYKAHPGLKVITITDHASGKWFFSQPDTVLDRQAREGREEEGQRFGPLKCKEEYLGKGLPALVTNAMEKHEGARDYIVAVLRERLAATDTALEHATANFYKDLWANGMGDYTTVYDLFLQQSYAFMLEWIFGMGEEGGQPLPPYKDFLTVNPPDLSVLIGLEVDTPVANLASKVAQAVAGGVSSEEKASVEVLLEAIRSSKMWPSFTKMLEESGLPTQDMDKSFMFFSGFQSSSALAKNMEYCVGSLAANPDFLAELRAELDGQQELTIKSVSDAKRFPLLDSFHWEILRLYPAPQFFFKAAQMDLVVPTSSGARYQVHKGDMLCCHHPLIHIDEAVFGADATEFKPKRFIGNPGLKDDVFAYAFPKPSEPGRVGGMPWGCAAHTVGVLDGILKVFYGRWVQEAEWEMKEPPIIDPVEYLGVVGPDGLGFAKVTPRK
ncbi:unnamed protein product [Ectocarpus sp. 8 AP-2014]